MKSYSTMWTWIWMGFLSAFSLLFIAQTGFVIYISENKQTNDKRTLLINNEQNPLVEYSTDSSNTRRITLILPSQDKSQTNEINVTESIFLYSNQRIVLYSFFLLLNLIAIIYFGYKLFKVQKIVHGFYHREGVRDFIIERINSATPRGRYSRMYYFRTRMYYFRRRKEEEEEQEKKKQLENLNKFIEKEISLLKSIDECSKNSFLNQLFNSKE